MSILSLLVDAFLAIWFICWPITAKKWGSTYIAQQSLLIVLYLIITNQLRRFLTLFLRGKTAKSIFGLLKLVLVFNLVFQPFISTLIPENLGYLYSSLLLLLEPYIIWLESKLVLDCIYSSGRWVTEFVCEITEESVLAKVAVVAVSAIIYLCSCVLLYKGMIQVQSHFFAWLALALVIIHTLAGIASYTALDGVITNSALVCLTSAVAFYTASLSTVMKSQEEASDDRPNEWTGQVSIYQQMNYLVTVATDETVTQQIFPRTPKTSGIIWIVSLIRVIAFVTWISNSLATSKGSGGGWKGARREEEENLDETNENFSQNQLILDGGSFDGISNVQSFPSWLKVSLDILDGDVATLNKIIAIILYTQQIIQASNEPSQSPSSLSFFPEEDAAVDSSWYPSYSSPSSFKSETGETFTNLHFLSVVRLVQSFYIAICFIFHLYGQIANDYSDGCYY